jgi:nucleotide-binding universal stress UspA family protein
MSSHTISLLPLEKVLVSTDGSTNASRAVQAAIDIAKRSDAQLIILTVIMEVVPPVYSPIGVDVPTVDYSAYLNRVEADAKKLVDEAAKQAQDQSVKTSVSILRSVTSVAEAIIEEASKDKVQLIIVGTRGLGGFKKLLLGSVSSAVIEHAPCSVLVVR